MKSLLPVSVAPVLYTIDFNYLSRFINGVKDAVITCFYTESFTLFTL